MEKTLNFNYNLSMIIPNEYFIYINILIALIYIVIGIISYRNGFLVQLITFIYNGLALFVSWFLAPIIASRLPLVNNNMLGNFVGIAPFVNILIYFLLIFIVLKLLYLLINPLLKKVSKIPIIGGLNKIGGLIFGFINATLIIILLSILLNTSIIKNGKEIKENTILKYFDNVTSMVVDYFKENVKIDDIEEQFNDLDIEKSREKFVEWLIEKGILNE